MLKEFIKEETVQMQRNFFIYKTLLTKSSKLSKTLIRFVVDDASHRDGSNALLWLYFLLTKTLKEHYYIILKLKYKPRIILGEYKSERTLLREHMYSPNCACWTQYQLLSPDFSAVSHLIQWLSTHQAI